MISSSYNWKLPLVKSADYLARVRFGNSTNDRVLVRIEKELSIGFYSVRRLLETYTVSDRTKALQFVVVWHKAIRVVDLMNAHRLDKNYDLALRNSEKRDIAYLSNLFIHSYVFVPEFKDAKLAGVHVASDRSRQSKCYFISRAQICKIFRTVGYDDPCEMTLSRDQSGQFVGTAR